MQTHRGWRSSFYSKSAPFAWWVGSASEKGKCFQEASDHSNAVLWCLSLVSAWPHHARLSGPAGCVASRRWSLARLAAGVRRGRRGPGRAQELRHGEVAAPMRCMPQSVCRQLDPCWPSGRDFTMMAWRWKRGVGACLLWESRRLHLTVVVRMGKFFSVRAPSSANGVT